MFESTVLPHPAVQGRTRLKRKGRSGSVFLKLKLLQAWGIFAYSVLFLIAHSVHLFVGGGLLLRT